MLFSQVHAKLVEKVIVFVQEQIMLMVHPVPFYWDQKWRYNLHITPGDDSFGQQQRQRTNQNFWKADSCDPSQSWRVPASRAATLAGATSTVSVLPYQVANILPMHV